MSAKEKVLTDSILLYALDHEAIYSLLDTLKPISSVQSYRLPLLSTHAFQRDSAGEVLQQLYSVANKLSIGDWQYVVQPFERNDSIYKIVEIYVVRKSKLQRLVHEQQAFYNNLGITENTNPATILAITEYEQKYTRWRSYGYLFGYPKYAVDFFVQAGKVQDSTKEFVKRDFFSIPVYAGNTGYFTYAIPKGHQPNATDSVVYNKALTTLTRYKKWRAHHNTPNQIRTLIYINKSIR